nr:flavodoxin-dependent (E)-4-hydroxy-3-methylbut-2-enyl-diphosphate synthase [Actinomycetota bacterium]
MVGDVPVGGGAPITVQSMTITRTADHEATLQQTYDLATAGAAILRPTCHRLGARPGGGPGVAPSPGPDRAAGRRGRGLGKGW